MHLRELTLFLCAQVYSTGDFFFSARPFKLILHITVCVLISVIPLTPLFPPPPPPPPHPPHHLPPTPQLPQQSKKSSIHPGESKRAVPRTRDRAIGWVGGSLQTGLLSGGEPRGEWGNWGEGGEVVVGLCKGLYKS